MQKHFDKVKQAKIDGKGLRLELIGTKHLTLEKFQGNGIWYTGVHDLTPCGTIIPLSGLNFDEEEWDQLVQFQEKINEVLASEQKESQGVKRDATGKEVTKDVLMYRWKWVVGKKKSVEGEAPLFSEEDCRIDAMVQKPDGDKANLVIEKIWAPPPPKYLHMHEVYLHLVKKFIEELSKQHCPGCKVNSPSQKDHVGGGCLDDEEDRLSLHCKEALKKVDKKSLVTLFDNSRKMIGASSSHSDLYAEMAQFYMDSETVFKTVKRNTKSVAMLLTRC